MEIFGRSAARPVTLHHARQQRIAEQNRRREMDREETARRIQQEKILEANMSSDDRVEERRFLKRLQQENMERETEEAIQKAQQQKALREQQREQEEKFAKELQLIKLDSMRDEKLRQQIRVNSLELRELEGKLRAGYMNKERAAQLAEKHAIKINEKKRENELEKEMQLEYERAKDMQLERDRKRWEESVQYQEQLEKQLILQEQKKQLQYEEFLKEKLMIDEIVKKIYEEDQREIEARLEKQKATQQYIEEFMSKRGEWKLNEQRLMEEENERILQFALQQQEREEARMSEKRKKEEEMSAVQNTLSSKIAQEQYERDEMERVRMELYQEEQEEANRQKEKIDMENRIRERLMLQDTMRQQLEMKENKKQAEKQEEEEFRQQMLAKFAEDDRIEQMNAQKRRMRQLEHKRAVDRLIEERRMQLEKDKERALEEQRETERHNAYRKQIIEEERQRLLKEHADKLLGYLPKGVLRDSQDLSMFDSDFQEAYARKKVDYFEDNDDDDI